MKYYIAYGSNLSTSQMKTRCPDAVPVGTATLKDWCLSFRLHATIEPDEGSEVPVGVWLISDTDERYLDIYEGYPAYYSKRNMNITMDGFDGQTHDVTAMVYIMRPDHHILPPHFTYYSVIQEGYNDFGLDDTPLKQALEDAITWDSLHTHGGDMS